MTCCGGRSGGVVWDQAKAQWRCIDCGSVQSSDANYISGWMKPVDLKFAPKKVCCCGAEKAKTTHSFWCDVKN